MKIKVHESRYVPKNIYEIQDVLCIVYDYDKNDGQGDYLYEDTLSALKNVSFSLEDLVKHIAQDVIFKVDLEDLSAWTIENVEDGLLILTATSVVNKHLDPDKNGTYMIVYNIKVHCYMQVPMSKDNILDLKSLNACQSMI
jgi:hypothetical protein